MLTTRRSGALIALACALATSTSSAAPLRKKAPGANRRAATTTTSIPQPAESTTGAGELRLASLRLVPGLGGGNLGSAGRIGGEFDYWFAQSFAAGVAASASVLIYRFEEARSYWLVGPVFAVRSNPRESYFLLSATLGAMRWSCAPGPCDDDGESGLGGLGAALKLGYIARLGEFELGPSLNLDVTRGHTRDSDPSITLSLGLELGLAL